MSSVVAIVQARMGSTRLPGKTMMDVIGKPAIWHLMNRLSYSKHLSYTVLATSISAKDDRLAQYSRKMGWHVYRGSEEDVLDRYYQTALAHGLQDDDVIVRITGDDILTDPQFVDLVIELYSTHRPFVRHASNCRLLNHPYGAYTEVFPMEALRQCWLEADDPEEREHVTPYIRNNPDIFPYVEIRTSVDQSDIHLSIDELKDLNFNRQIFSELYKEGEYPFLMSEILEYISRKNREEIRIL